jgi:flagellar hook protein FlgE
MGSFSTPLSGLTAAQDQLQSVSNNLANIDTDGYKDQTLTFSDIFAQTGATNGSGDPIQTGSGVAVASTTSNYSDGSLNATGTSSNMALSGSGFFVTQGASGAQTYTRAGDFTTNNAGQLTTPSGDLVLGYPAVNGVVNTSGALQPLQVSSVTISAVASTTVGVTANLNSASAIANNDTVFTGGATTDATPLTPVITGAAAAADATLLTSGNVITITDSITGKTLTVTGGTPVASGGSGNALTATAATVGDLNSAIATAFGGTIAASDSTGKEVFTSTDGGLQVAETGTDLGALSTAVPTITITDTTTGKTLTVTGGANAAVAGSGTALTATAATVGDLNSAIASAFGTDGSNITASNSTGNEVISSTTDGLTVTQTGTALGTITGTETPSFTGSSAATSTVSVYDSLGTEHTLTVSYAKTAANTWAYNVSVPSSDITGGTGTSTIVGSGVLNFNTSGALTSISNAVPIAISGLSDGAANLTLSGPFGTASSRTITQTALASATSATSTDGLPSGTLSSYAVDTDGTIEGTFSGGKTLALGQVAVASFANNEGLVSVGNNEYQQTVASGGAVIGTAGTGGRGTITGGSVEGSNVNIATEFAKLIVAQQAYSANAKSITAFNSVSQATLAMIQ